MAIGARNAASAILSQITSSLHGIEGAAASARGALTLVAGAVGVAAAGALAYGIDQATHYQDSLRQIEANAHLTANATQGMGTAIEQTAIGMTSNANAMAAALAPVAGELERVTGQTLSTADASKVLVAAQNLAESSHISLTAAMKSIVDTLLVYKQTTRSAASDATAFFDAQAQLGVGADQIARMLQRLQPRIAGSGASIQQVLGIVRELSGPGGVGTGSRAIMMVGTVLQALQSPSVAAQKALAALGVTTVDAQGKFLGFPSVLDQVKAAYDRLPASVAAGSKEISKQTLLQALFGRQANIAAGLVEGGAKGIADNTAALRANGTAAQAAELQTTSLSGIMRILKSDFDTAMTAIGGPGVRALSSFLKPVIDVANSVARLVVQFPGLSAAILSVVAVLGGFVGLTKILGPLLGGLGIDIGAVAAPVLLAAAAVGGFVLLVQKVPGMLEPVSDALTQVGRLVQGLGPAFGQVAAAVGALISGSGSLSDLGTALSNLGAAIQQQLAMWGPRIVASLGDAAQALGSWVGQAAPVVLGALLTLAAGIVSWAAGIAPQVVAGLADLGGRLAAAVLMAGAQLAGAMARLGAQAIASFVRSLATDPGRIASNLGNLLRGGAILGAVVVAGEALGAAWSGAVAMGMRAQAAIGAAASSMAETLELRAMYALDAIVGPITAALAPIGAALGSALDAAIGVGMAAAPFILVAAAVGLFLLLLTNASIRNTAIRVGTAVVHAIAGAIAGAANLVGKAIHSLPLIGNVMDILGTAVGAATNLGASVVHALIGGITSLVSALGNAVVLLPLIGPILFGIELLTGKADTGGKEIGSRVLNAIIDGIQSVVGALGNAVTALPLIGPLIGGIESLVGSAVSGATKLGTSVVDAIASGITGAAGSVVSAVHSLPLIGNLMDIGGSLVGAAASLGAQVGSAFAAGVAGGKAAVTAPPPPPSTGLSSHIPEVRAAAAESQRLATLGGGYAGSTGAEIARIRAAASAAAAEATTATSTHAAATSTHKAATSKAVSAANTAAGAYASQLASTDAVTKAQQALAVAQAKAAGQSTALLSATDAVTNAQDAVALAQAKLKAAEEATYKSSTARIAAVDKAETALEIATTKLATAREKAGMTASTTMAHAQSAVTKAEQSLATAEDALAKAQAARRPNVAAVTRDEQRVTTAQTKLTDAQNALADIEQQLGIATSAAQRTLSTTTVTVAGAAAAQGISTGVGAGAIQQAASGALLVAADSTWASWQDQVVTLLTGIGTTLGSLLAVVHPVPTTALVTSTGAAPRTVTGGQTIIRIDNRILLDPMEMRQWVSQVVAEDERRLAGPATSGSVY